MNEKIDRNFSSQEPLTITRTFMAPRDQIFDGFINDEKLKQWWSPKDFTCSYFKNDPRVGGTYLGCMRSSDGKKIWSKGYYIEIRAAEKLKYSDSFADENGKVVPATVYHMSSEFPLECIVEIVFSDVVDGTKITLKHSGIPEVDLKNCTLGWEECLNKLGALVENSGRSNRSEAEIRSTSTSVNQNIDYV